MSSNSNLLLCAVCKTEMKGTVSAELVATVALQGVHPSPMAIWYCYTDLYYATDTRDCWCNWGFSTFITLTNLLRIASFVRLRMLPTPLGCRIFTLFVKHQSTLTVLLPSNITSQASNNSLACVTLCDKLNLTTHQTLWNKVSALVRKQRGLLWVTASEDLKLKAPKISLTYFAI